MSILYYLAGIIVVGPTRVLGLFDSFAALLSGAAVVLTLLAVWCDQRVLVGGGSAFVQTRNAAIASLVTILLYVALEVIDGSA